MSVHKHNSWGRTRRPKQMSENAPSSKQTAITVTVVTAANLANDLDGSNAGENGYVTENQRFLHVWVNHDSAASKEVEIYAYNYAFGAWAKLFLPLGNGTTSEVVASNGASGPTPHMFVFEITGIDRVAFVSADAPATVRAACSTF
jgi:hypothetical protein